MKHSITFIGYDKERDMFKLSVDINGYMFDYFVGIGHMVPHSKKEKGESYSLIKNIDSDQLDRLYIKSSQKRLTVYEASKNCGSYFVKIPNIDSILYCLFTDSDAGNMLFYDFCSDFGYDTDSRSAFDIYTKCQDIALKLRKCLGSEYDQIKERVLSNENQ